MSSPFPLLISRDWSHVDLDGDRYVAIIRLDHPSSLAYLYVAVRGGLTTGHWSEREAAIVGQRLADEISGHYSGVLQAGVWEAFANPACSQQALMTVRDFFVATLDDDEADRTIEQYKSDPLVTGTGLEV